jgi:hypothetical protein
MNIKEFQNSLKASGKFTIKSRVEEINYHDYLPVKQKRQFFSLKLVSVFSSFILVGLLTLFAFFNFHPVASLSIEINPELNLELNRYNRVINVTGENDEALALIDELDIKYKKIDQAVEIIYDYSQDNDYTVDDNLYVLYGIQTEKESVKLGIKQILEATVSANIRIIVITDLVRNDGGIELSPSTGPDTDYESPSYMDNQDVIIGEYESLITEYDISDARLSLIIAIYNNHPEYTMEYLLELDLAVLYELYNE